MKIKDNEIIFKSGYKEADIIQDGFDEQVKRFNKEAKGWAWRLRWLENRLKGFNDKKEQV